MTAAACLECGEGLQHCHGVLVEHVGGNVECTEGGVCEEVVAEHDAVLGCGDLLRACGCVVPDD